MAQPFFTWTELAITKRSAASVHFVETKYMERKKPKKIKVVRSGLLFRSP